MSNYENNSCIWSGYQNIIDRNPVLSAAEELELIGKAKAGDKKARDKLVYSNMRYIIKISKSYLGRGFSKDDIIEEGLSGLIIALDKFDVSKNVRFITYAKIWINKAILDSIYNTADMIRLPQNKIRNTEKINVISLDAPVGNVVSKSAVSYEELVADNCYSAENEVEREDLKNNVSLMLSVLSKKENLVISLHNGLIDEPLSYAEIGDVLGISRQAVRQIEEKAMRKLRDAESYKYVDGYLAA